MPGTFRVTAAGQVPADAPVDNVDTAAYELQPIQPFPIGMETLRLALEDLLKEQTLIVERVTKSGRRQVDLKPLILRAEVPGDKIWMLVRSGSRGNVRPDELLTLLQEEPARWQVHRVGLFIAQNGRLSSPMEEAGVVVDGS